MKRVVELKGHILDSDLLSDALDAVLESGGDYSILRLDVGKARDNTSYARVSVNGDDALFQKLLSMGVLVPTDAPKRAGRGGPNDFSDEELRGLKMMGFSDDVLGDPEEVRAARLERNIVPAYKMVDTCAGEFEAVTPYYYSSYESEDEDIPSDCEKVIIIGSGPIRIGQGIEFDTCTVHAIFALNELGIESIIINNNPETVSTDFDVSSKLYFEPITLEDVLNIVSRESKNLLGVFVQFGGQTGINMAMRLSEAGVRVLGTDPKDIDVAEDREKFGRLLERLNMPYAKWGVAYSPAQAKKISKGLGYPVLVRPSYVLGGRAMEIVHDTQELETYIEEAAAVSPKHPVFIDKFLQDAMEVDVDAVSDGEDVLIGAVMEHIEEAGIHSGDSACVVPPQTLSEDVVNIIKEYTASLAKELKVIGFLNVQYAVKDGSVYTLEANPRASRTVPFVYKAVGVPLAKLAAKVMVEGLKDITSDFDPMVKIGHVAVKEVVFPFAKHPEVDPVLGPEMKSTGEVIGIDCDFGHAYYKAQLAAGNRLPEKGTVFISVRKSDRELALEIAKKFETLGFGVLCTPGTERFLTENGVVCVSLNKISQGSPNILDFMRANTVDFIINTATEGRDPARDGYMIRRAAVEMGIPFITTMTGALASVNAIESLKSRRFQVLSWNEYHGLPR